MTIKKHIHEDFCSDYFIYEDDLKGFINNKLDELGKLKADCEFRIMNIVNHDHYDYYDEYDNAKIRSINSEIQTLNGAIHAYGELMKELS